MEIQMNDKSMAIGSLGISRRAVGLLALAIMALVWSCDSGDDGAETVQAPVGAERGDCYPNGTCDEGLTCLSSRCVAWNPDSGQVGPDGNDLADTNSADTSASDAGNFDTGGDAVDEGSGGLSDVSTDVAEPPSAPSDLVAQDAADAKVEITWSDNADTEAGFVVERKSDVGSTSFEPTSFTQLTQLGANTTSFVDTEVFMGVEYIYRVRAVNAAGNSGWSNEAAHRTAVPTLQVDVAQIFDRSCGSSTTGCHTRKAYAATADRDCRGWLSLENASIGSVLYGDSGNAGDPTGCEDRDLHYRLTQIRAWQCNNGAFKSGDADYVIPDDPKNSYLWQKIMGTRLCDNGGEQSSRMPMVGQLSTEELMTIRQWIANGAQP
jgi:hypothetical protein